MPIYRALEPFSYIDDNGKVRHITQVGATFSATTAQAALMDPDKIEYVSTDNSHYYAPTATFLLFDNRANFPPEGGVFHLYLDQSTGRVFRWDDWSRSYEEVIGATGAGVDEVRVSEDQLTAEFLREGEIVGVLPLPAGIALTPTAVSSGAIDPLPGRMVVVDPTVSTVITLPTDVVNTQMVGIWLEGDGLASVVIQTAGGATLRTADSDITSLTINSSNIQVGLSIWRYNATGNYWHPIAFHAAPSVTDIVDASLLGRALLTSSSAEDIRALIGAVSHEAVADILQATWVTPTFDASSPPVSETFPSASSGEMIPFLHTATAGACVVVPVFGYRTQAAAMSLTVTYGGVEMLPVGPMVMGNDAAVNAVNTSFVQFFILTSAPSGARPVVVSWSSSVNCTPTIAVSSASWNGVESIGSQLQETGSEPGTTLTQTIASAPGRVIVQLFGHESLFNAAISGYNQNVIADLDAGSVGYAVFGWANGFSPTVTFNASRANDSDYMDVAFHLIGEVTYDNAALLIEETSAFGRDLVATPDAAAARTLLDVGAGGGGGGGPLTVVDYGADPTGVADATGAFQSAINAGPVRVPAGTFSVNTGALKGANIRIVGDGNLHSTINLGAGTYFIDDDQVWNTFHLEGIRFNGGAGIVRHRRTGINVTNLLQVVDCAFIGYTACAIQSNSTDEPYWKIHRNYFHGTNSTMGVALSGLTDGVSITDNEFVLNRVHIKLREGGNNAYLTQNDFLRFAAYAGTPRVDVWVVPKSGTFINSGTGMVLKHCKFGNEGLNQNDWRILYADEGAGTLNGEKFPVMTASTGYITGHVIEDVALIGLGDSNQIPLVYSTTPLVAGCKIGCTQAGNSVPAPVLASLTPLTYPNRNQLSGAIGMGFAASQPVTGMVGSANIPLLLWTGTQGELDSLAVKPLGVYVVWED